MNESATRPRTTRTLAVSEEFADMITTLARAKDLSVERYCDEFGTPKFAADYQSLLAAKLKALSKRG